MKQANKKTKPADPLKKLQTEVDDLKRRMKALEEVNSQARQANDARWEREHGVR
jgi:FtsZ-binding cell division protein ZapB